MLPLLNGFMLVILRVLLEVLVQQAPLDPQVTLVILVLLDQPALAVELAPQVLLVPQVLQVNGSLAQELQEHPQQPLYLVAVE
jgi:hypothetical protein